MKNVWHIIIYAALAGTAMSCVRESLSEDPVTKEPFNIDAFSDGYSVAFELDLDRMGGDTGTRSGEVDAKLEVWENYINPEEFRILFFDANDNFLFESKTRWFTQIEAHHGSSRWRVGVPIFPYLSDGYDENISSSKDYSVSDAYDWERIAEIMRTQPFKIAIMANRPYDIIVPDLSDLEEAEKSVASFGKNGPFWSPKNSIATYDDVTIAEHKDDIKTVFDLHHCQYDPFYENKNIKDTDCYSFLFEYSEEETDKGKKVVPFMGAVSGWLHSKRERRYRYHVKRTDGKDPDLKEGVRYFYRLPISQVRDRLVRYTPSSSGNIVINNGDYIEDLNFYEDVKEQYIPMYGIQQFNALTQWTKGTTYNLSGQVGSQTGDYDYKSISLLRSVVKLELRIPKYDNNRNAVTVNNMWAQICGNNFMARCEPMDVWTPTNEIWKDHATDCEWIDIRNYGLLADGKPSEKARQWQKLSWFYGAWKEDGKWPFDNIDVPGKVAEDGSRANYPRIFNPITQRLQIAFITDCKVDTNEDDYHRWVIYCGERNMNDPNKANDLSSPGYVSYFRIPVNIQGTDYIYNIPITDYSTSTNPAKDKLKERNGNIIEIHDYPSYMNDYYSTVRGNNTSKIDYPYPLLRNHMYRLTVSFGNGDDIDVHMMDGEKRVVGGIVFE